jgi:hypothetical protein
MSILADAFKNQNSFIADTEFVNNNIYSNESKLKTGKKNSYIFSIRIEVSL